MDDISEIKNADRADLVKYLESWGFQCYDKETDDELRAAATENFQTEGPGTGPTQVKAPSRRPR